MKTIFLTLFILAAGCPFSYGQLKVDNTEGAEFYVRNVLIGPGIKVGNIRHAGMLKGLGSFTADSSLLGMRSGLILSTGNTDSIIGPNDLDGYTSWGGLPPTKKEIALLRRGDKDLNKICGGKTTDITVIEFDFIAEENVLEFNYVFASEEYKEYTGSSYNDVFGFFLSGPGIKKKINLAVLPDGKTPISINNINHKNNKQYFIDNTKIGFFKKLFSRRSRLNAMEALRSELQFDGLTTVLTVHCDVVPYNKYHIKIAIGDVEDSALDSGVFLEAGSFVSKKDTQGKYYTDLKTLENRIPNTDSLLAIHVPAVEIVSAPVSEHFELTDIYFEEGSFSLPDSAKADLDNLSEYLLEKEAFKCTLYGYTNNVGSKSYNQTLSENRALGTINYLVSKGIDRNRLNYVGLSFENPRYDNTTAEGLAKNRRVEIVIEEGE